MMSPPSEHARGAAPGEQARGATPPARPARGYIALDLGASSGRVMLGVADGGGLSMHEVHRFATGIRQVQGRTTWDMGALHAASIEGIALAVGECTARGIQPAGIGDRKSVV